MPQIAGEPLKTSEIQSEGCGFPSQAPFDRLRASRTGFSPAPLTPLTTAKAVMMPSLAPKTQSPMWCAQEGQKPSEAVEACGVCLAVAPPGSKLCRLFSHRKGNSRELLRLLLFLRGWTLGGISGALNRKRGRLQRVAGGGRHRPVQLRAAPRMSLPAPA